MFLVLFISDGKFCTVYKLPVLNTVLHSLTTEVTGRVHCFVHEWKYMSTTCWEIFLNKSTLFRIDYISRLCFLGSDGLHNRLSAYPRLLLDGAPQRHLSGCCIFDVRQGGTDDMRRGDRTLLLWNVHHFLHYYRRPVGYLWVMTHK